RADEIERAPERIPVQGIAEYLRVVPRADPAEEWNPEAADLDRRARRAQQIDVGEREPERVHEREGDDEPDREQRRPGEQPGHGALGQRTPCLHARARPATSAAPPAPSAPWARSTCRG